MFASVGISAVKRSETGDGLMVIFLGRTMRRYICKSGGGIGSPLYIGNAWCCEYIVIYSSDLVNSRSLSYVYTMIVHEVGTS